MFQFHVDAKYIDMLERSLYNNMLSGGPRGDVRGAECQAQPLVQQFVLSVESLALYFLALGLYLRHGQKRAYVNLFGSSEATASPFRSRWRSER